MKFVTGEETVDTIEAGELLTVLEESEEAYVVITFRGKRGQVSKAYAVKLAESVEVYSQLIEGDAEQGRLYALRANAWWAQGSIDQALKDFDRAIELGKQDPDGYCHRGLCYAALGKHEEAIRDYGTAIQLDRGHEAAYINRGAAYMAQQKYQEALQDYSEAIGLKGGKRASTYEQRAVAWKQVGVLAKALSDFGKSLELNPNSVTAYMGRGFLWFQTDHPERAIADFSEAIRINPRESQAFNNRGFNYRLLGQDKQALADFEQATTLDPTYALAFQNLAWILAGAGDAAQRDGKRAVQAATKACELNRYEDPLDLQSLAAAYAEIGDFAKAVGLQERATTMLPEDERELAEEIAGKYRAEKPFRLADLTSSDSSGDGREPDPELHGPLGVTLKNGSPGFAVHVCLGEAKATGEHPHREITELKLSAGEEKVVQCKRVISYFTGVKWKNVYVLEEGVVTFSVQRTSPNESQWVSAVSVASDDDAADLAVKPNAGN